MTPQAPAPGAWAGELAQLPGAFSPRWTLGEIAAKYDTVTQIIGLDAMDETDEIDETDLLASLLVIRVLRDKFLADEGRIIGAARRKQVTWQRLADALELKSRQAAERRYLQLRTDIDEASGDSLTQNERVEYARAQRDRLTERLWATRHRDAIVALARRLAAIPDLQQRADRSGRAGDVNSRAAWNADQSGTPRPAPVQMPWPAQLAEAVAAEDAHRAAGPVHRVSDFDPTRLTAVQQANLVHLLFGLIGYAFDAGSVDLSDHRDLVADIVALYSAAGSAAPRVPEDYTSAPRQE
ncbi:hypothetical protein OG453_38650 [Streptomyces sp. NBC_01381]|uniref:hypothetical protein n=1 Tax=Streptomyces sp. NBC_01381 TaxID=2903845 RepID=UPI0022527FAF|nr:hypothetical protein [Streptomyces sp. NBC_01381]MCX4672502.1 hypothetical protein [Streptomyces sp. NBC_01381]